MESWALTGRIRCAAALLLAVIPCAACGAGQPTVARPSVRDSAGITIIENRAAAWTETERWRVPGPPLVDIGVLERDSLYQLFRVVDAARLSDGRIVVANAGTSELRYYDAEGSHLRSAGRQGGGPGEFERIAWIESVAGDSVLAYDAGLRRLSTFGPAGRFLRNRTLRSAGEAASADAVGRFADGSYLLEGRNLPSDDLPESGLLRSPSTLYRSTGQEAALDTLGRYPGSEGYLSIQRSGGTISSVFIFRPPSMHRLVLTAHGDRVYVGPQDTHEIIVRSITGSPERRIRWPGRELVLTPEIFERYKADRLARSETEAERRSIERLFTISVFPERLPAHGRILTDALGNLWVEHFRRPGDEANRWSVFEADGLLLGVVDLPGGLELYQVGRDFVLGRWQDDLEVEHVRLYPLVKASAPLAGA